MDLLALIWASFNYSRRRFDANIPTSFTCLFGGSDECLFSSSRSNWVRAKIVNSIKLGSQPAPPAPP